jgi:ABC-type transport system involved in cytochrome c biogenesis permease subunit
VERKKWSVRWHGNILQINEIEIQFEILPSVSMKNITLRATHSEQSSAGWRILREVLRTELQSQHSKFNGFGFLLITCGLIIVVVGWAWTSLV